MNISVAMAYYNGGQYIEEQLQSILSQIGPEDEIIVSVDGADDGSMEYLLEKARGDRRIRLTKGPGRGVVKNFEHAISQCQGDYIFLSDQDDIWMADKVEKVRKALGQEGTVAVLHNGVLADEQGRTIEGPSLFELRNSRDGILHNLVKNSYMGCCMAFRKELVPIILPIPEEMYMHDYWIGTAAEMMGRVALIKKPLIKYRRHQDNVTDLEHGSTAFMLKKRLYMVRCLQILKKRVKGKKGETACVPKR